MAFAKTAGLHGAHKGCHVCTRKGRWERRGKDLLQAHDAMNTLKTNLRQEHWESLSWASSCHQLLTPWQMATLLVETHPQWCAPIA